MALTNRRIFYASEQFGFAPFGTVNYIVAHGVQSAGVETAFNQDLVQEIGQLSVYQQVELLPDITLTAEKVLDGYPPLCLLATYPSPDPSLVGRSNTRTTAAFSIFSDFQLSASGTPLAEVQMSGLYWSGTTFNFAVDGVARETFQAVGNNKLWRDIAGGAPVQFSGFFTNNDSPFAQTAGSGGVQRRQNMIFYPIGNGSPASENNTALDANGQLNAFLTILPPDVGVSSSGTNDFVNGNFLAHIQDVTVTANFTRTGIPEQGRKDYFFRYLEFPTEVTTTINVHVTKWDNTSALALGLYPTGPNQGDNTTNRSIRVRMQEGLCVDLGKKNKMTGVTFNLGGTDGSNATASFTYRTYNDLTISHPQDPSALPWPTLVM